MPSVADQLKVENLTVAAIVVASSRPKRVLLCMLVLATPLTRFLELIAGGRFGLLTDIAAVLVVYQALRTFVQFTVFLDDRIEHRTKLGRTRRARYEDVSVLEQQGQFITISGKDLGGRGLEFTIRRRDGNLSDISRLLSRKAVAGNLIMHPD